MTNAKGQPLRRFSAILLLFSAVALLGIAPPLKATPKPAPATTPAPVPAPTRQPIPMVVVFPFQTSSDLKADTGQRAGELFVQQMNAAGGIDAVLAPATVQKTDYLSYAQKLQADYYLMGYMTPLGNGVSLVEQVVSTQSGTIAYGSTAQIDSFDDASSQALQMHAALLAMEANDAERYSQAQAESTTTPAPTSQSNVSKGISDIAGFFKHRAATPKPVAAPKPDKGIFVVRASGQLPANNLNEATRALYSGLNVHFNTHMTSVVPRNLTQQADGICGSSRDNTIATGSLAATTSRHGLGVHTQWSFTMDVYTCFGAKLAESAAQADTLEAAVKQAVDAYATAHPENS